LLNIFVKFENRHTDLLKNALFMIIFLLAIHMVNNYVSAKNFETTFMAFTPEGAIE
jgi:hypothetical protein